MSNYLAVTKSDIFVPREAHPAILKALVKKLPVVADTFRCDRRYLPITRRNLMDELEYWFVHPKFDENYNLVSLKFTLDYDLEGLFKIMAKHMTRDGEILVESEDGRRITWTFRSGKVTETTKVPETLYRETSRAF